MSAGSGRRWGWHQLEPEWAQRVVAAAGVRPGELVLDLGAGTGALTAPLTRAGARVVAVELHPRRVARLRDRFGDQPRVRVVPVDLTLYRLPREPFRVVANPPYTLTAELLRRLWEPRSRMYAADLLLPRWAVNRWNAEPPRRRWVLEAGLRVPRHAFTPPPRVDAAVLVLRRRG